MSVRRRATDGISFPLRFFDPFADALQSIKSENIIPAPSAKALLMILGRIWIFTSKGKCERRF